MFLWWNSDGTNFSTQVPVVKGVWVSVAMSSRARNSMSLSPEDPAAAALPGTEKPLSMTVGG
jgi:hypothetical protein